MLSLKSFAISLPPLVSLIIPGFLFFMLHFHFLGWSGGAMVLGKLPVPGRPTIWIQ